MFVFLNTKILPIEKAKIPVTDQGFTSGVGVFETILVKDKKIYFLAEHLVKMQENLCTCDIHKEINQKIITEAIEKLIQKNQLLEARVRITTTPETLLITTVPLTNRSKMAKIITIKMERPNPQIKSTNYLPSVLAQKESKKLHADEALLVNRNNEITEGARSNFFIIQKGKIFTPLSKDIRPGVTRDKIFLLAKTLQISLQEKIIRLSDLQKAEEIFLTNALIEIWPVSHFNNCLVKNGKIGPITKILLEAWKNNFL